MKDAHNKPIEPGDIIQITNPANKWFPCLLVVDEPKSFGAQAYAWMPQASGQSGQAYYRLNSDEFELVGKAVILTDDGA